MRRFLIVLFVCCLAAASCQREPTPPQSTATASQNAVTAADYVNRGNESADKGEFEKAIAAYTQAITAASPNDPKDKEAIIYAYNFRGNVRESKGEHDKAIADYDQALAIDPKNAQVYLCRGIAWDGKREYDNAIADDTEALAIDPNFAYAFYYRGVARAYKGEYDKAIADFTKAVAIDPKCDLAYDELAKIYASCADAKYRDGKKAVENANRAHQLTGRKKWTNLCALAAAYAESGDFAKARDWQEKAIELAPENSKQGPRNLLELYKQGKPYHEPPVKK